MLATIQGISVRDLGIQETEAEAESDDRENQEDKISSHWV